MAEGLICSDNRFIIKDGAFVITRYVEPLKENSSPHTHDCVEICYVYSGNGYHQVDGRVYEVYKGDLFIINYDMAHTFYSRSEKNPVITYNIMFKPGFLDDLLINFNSFNSLTLSFLFKNIWNEDSLKEDLRLTVEEQQDFDMLVLSMYREYTGRQDGYMDIIRAYTIQLIIKIMRCFNNRASIDDSVKRKATVIDSVIKHLHDNYSQSYNLNDLALKSFFSKNYICRLFKEATGITISEYIQHIRIEEACKLLETSEKKIVDIGLEVGFSDYKAFNTVFKRVRGILPKQYRANNNKDRGTVPMSKDRQ